MADLFLDGKPMKQSKNGSDVIFGVLLLFCCCVVVVVAFHDSSCSSILHSL